ncbi:Kunitz/Bovine pancreatic trypsin inhibitor domain protein [Opisthorchis viverrini]|uniref:Kunitz/Bovine pancreatic trypsin inhibitor domain protein n=1 Tax=Opisthorchis viverrini TaxID=6198 RepID=A0A1S8WYZ9_OPIVI|nr:Kunitz/Bovine pancreatic trypsin inhibitor domain protein [Opisthorchis viverrini]
MAVGDCEHKWPYHYFDKEKGECVDFEYSGCGGNDNKFRHVEDCRETCMS